MGKNNNEAIQRVCDATNSLFPGLNVTLNDLSQPTEVFLTRTLIHYLRAFMFRVEPPYNIEGEGNNETSKEKRQFLSRLCRQVERIWQISFPAKTYTFIDIIQPTSKKTYTTIDVLFNHYCFYKMHKKSVLAPINERHNKRQSQGALILAKQRELEEGKERLLQEKIDIAQCETKIGKLREELLTVQAELTECLKGLKQKHADLAAQEELRSETRNQVSHLKQLLVEESEMERVKEEMVQIVAKTEGYKQEMARQAQIFKKRRMVIETNSLRNDEVEKIMKILPPEVVNEYKENLKQTERMKNKHAILKSMHRNFQATREKLKQQLEQCDAELKALKLQHEEDAQLQQERILQLKTLNEQLAGHVEEDTKLKSALQEEFDAVRQIDVALEMHLPKLLHNNEN